MNPRGRWRSPRGLFARQTELSRPLASARSSGRRLQARLRWAEGRAGVSDLTAAWSGQGVRGWWASKAPGPRTTPHRLGADEVAGTMGEGQNGGHGLGRGVLLNFLAPAHRHGRADSMDSAWGAGPGAAPGQGRESNPARGAAIPARSHRAAPGSSCLHRLRCCALVMLDARAGAAAFCLYIGCCFAPRLHGDLIPTARWPSCPSKTPRLPRQILGL